MTNHVLALGSALYSTLNTAGTIPVYYNLAPQNTSPPYAIFQPQSLGVEDYNFGNTRFTYTLYTLKVVDNKLYPTNNWILFEHLDNAIQHNNLTVTGFQTLRCTRDSLIEFRDNEKFWHCGSIYKIDLHS